MIRFFDIVFSLLGILLLSPVFLLLYIAICLESKGGGFYKQLRVGRYGGDFYVYKFRSMRVGADKKGLITVGGRDPRITRTGYLIRKYKLDELPQLFNVLKGDMSIVGTRPPLISETNLYELHHKARLAIKPGITGMWQVSGRSDITDFEEVVRLDREYISNWNIGMDIKILVKTVMVVLKEDGSM